MNGISYREVGHGTEEYWAAVELRRRVLRIPLGLDFSEEELEAESVDRHLVALDAKGDVVGGLVVVTVAGGGNVRMRQVAVDPGLQGRGIGSGLVGFFEQVCGAEVVELHARETARDFYERLGYGVVGEVFTEVGLRHWKMRKML